MSRISKLRESTETRLAIMEKHAFAMETLVREGPEEALGRLEVLKGQLKDRLELTLELLVTLEGPSTETLTMMTTARKGPRKAPPMAEWLRS
jgi:hypothetical protein